MKAALIVAAVLVLAVLGFHAWLDRYEATYLLEQARDRVPQPLGALRSGAPGAPLAQLPVGGGKHRPVLVSAVPAHVSPHQVE